MRAMRPVSASVLVGLLGLAVAAVPCGAAEEPEPSRGTLVIAGGGLRFDNEAVWSRIVAAAGGERAEIAVIPAASSSPKAGLLVAETLRQRGASPFVVRAGATAEEIAHVAAAGGVFFTGGAQQRIIAALTRPETGALNPLGEAVWAVYRRGGVVAGTSAGAAVMSRIMYRDAPRVLRTLTDSLRMGQEVGRGLGFIDGQWFIDQHALTRGRFARCLVAMRDFHFPYALAIDEDTAVVVRTADPQAGPVAEVVGYQGVLFIDQSAARSDNTRRRFNMRNVRLSYLDRGDAINLRTREIIPSKVKTSAGSGEELDPQRPDFAPETYPQPIFTSDILGNTTVMDLMRKLMISDQPEAVGLAFDGRAMQETIDGFRFRLYRGDDSTGWYTGALGGEAYTLCNVHLDVEPIQLRSPLSPPTSTAQTERPVTAP